MHDRQRGAGQPEQARIAASGEPVLSKPQGQTPARCLPRAWAALAPRACDTRLVCPVPSGRGSFPLAALRFRCVRTPRLLVRFVVVLAQAHGSWGACVRGLVLCICASAQRGYSDTAGRQQARTQRGAAMPHGADQLPIAIAGAIATAVGAVVTTLLAAVVLAAQRAHAATHSTAGSEQRTRGRRLWVRERPPAWWDTTAQDFDDAEFRSHFRMCWETFYFVADTLRPQIQRKDTRWREALGFQKVTAIALYRLATGTDAYTRPQTPCCTT